MSVYPEAYIEYLVFFHAERDYFECHEVMEAYWKETSGSEFSEAWLGLIQVAVSQYHERRGNLAGACKMMESALRNLQVSDLEKLGLDGEDLLTRLRERRNALRKPDTERPAFTDLDFSIRDPELLGACRQLADDKGVFWQQQSDHGDEDLIHKHTRRDRTGVLEERERSKAAKQLARGKNSV